MPNLNSAWRLTASTIYKKPVDSKILGSVELDVTDLAIFIKEKRSEGLKITYSHFFLLAIAKTIHNHIPEFNSYLSRGTIKMQPDLVAALSILTETGEMSTLKIPAIHTFNLNTLLGFLQNQIQTIKNGNESKLMKLKNGLGGIPWPFRTWVYSLIKFLTIDLSLSLPFLNLTPTSFGSFVLSNIGTLGLDIGYPALLPSANLPLVILMGRPQPKPWVHNGQIVIREILTLSAAIDHRLADASHAGKLFNHLRNFVAHPSLLEN